MEKQIIAFSKVLSMVFNPFYLSFVGVILLFLCSYLSLLPWAYKGFVLLLVYAFTILIPTLLIRLYGKYEGRELFMFSKKEYRVVPYIIALVCYSACFYILTYIHVPYFVSIIIVISILLQILCAIINVWFKVSTHSAAIGSVTGSLVVFSFIFNFYLLGWLSLALIISGLVGSARLILRQHTLSQVLIGYLLGFTLSVVVILYA